MAVTRLVLARHGETTGESSVRYFGATDVLLSDAGRAQARALAERLVAERPDRVLTSRLRRARETGEIVAARLGLTAVADGGFDEVDFGAWEGLTREEIAAKDPDLFRRWVERDPLFAYPGGGTVVASFRERVAAAVGRVLEGEEGRTVVVVTHAGVVRAALGALFGFPGAGQGSAEVGLASLHVIEAGAARPPALVLANDSSHLGRIRVAPGDSG